jgi:hypothetical protein
LAQGAQQQCKSSFIIALEYHSVEDWVSNMLIYLLNGDGDMEVAGGRADSWELNRPSSAPLSILQPKLSNLKLSDWQKTTNATRENALNLRQ